MARIRELQPAHKSDKVTVGEAARAFRKVRSEKAYRQRERNAANTRVDSGRPDGRAKSR